VKEIEKTAESIRKKHRALKTGKIEEDIATKSHFKPIIKPLQKIVNNSSMRAIKDEPRDDDDVKTLSIQKREEDAKWSKRKRSNTSLDRKSKRLDASGLDASPITSTPSATTDNARVTRKRGCFRNHGRLARNPFKISCKRWRVKKH